MVQGFVGLPGSGKTYLLAKQGLDDIKNGKEVYANFHLKGAKHFSSLTQIIAIIKKRLQTGQNMNITVLIDEINLSFPSRMWNKVPGWVLYFWSQTRKFGCDIYYTSQSINRIDKVIREVSNFVWIIKPFFFGIHIGICVLPEDTEKSKRDVIDRKFFRIRKEVFENYNTYEILDFEEEFLK